MRPNLARRALVISSAAELLVRSVWTVEIVPLSLLSGAGCECLQRLTIAVDAGDPDAYGQQTERHRFADATGRTGHNRHSLGFGHG